MDPRGGATAEERARQGLRFGPAAARYERGRSGWPAAAVDLIATGLALGPDSVVVEVGAGTGKLTRVLAGRFARVVAVEPLAPLRELAERVPGVEVRDGTAERLPVPDRSADAVVAAEAFHWFDGPAALAEAARVLRPDGGVALLWNLPDGPQQPPLPEPARRVLADAIAADGSQPGGTLVRRGDWRAAFANAPFGPLQHGTAGHEVVRGREELIDFYLSMSSLADLPEPAGAALAGTLRGLLPDTRFRQQLRVDTFWAVLAPWCDHCGGDRAGTDHRSCAAARELEPPRYCPRCRRRLTVQVLPAGWSATCSRHGATPGQPS